MDEDELLYREMNPEDPWYMGDDKEDEEESFTDEEDSRRNAIVLFWNPDESNYTNDRYAEDREKFGQRWQMNWSIHLIDDVQEGDRYYMVRLGTEPCGIVWQGTVASAPYKDKDFRDGRRKSWYIDINVEHAVKPDEKPLVSLAEMKAENPDNEWESMLCGQPITAEFADIFDGMISRNRYRNSHPYKGYPSKEAYEEEQKKQLRDDISWLISMVIILLGGVMAFYWLLT